MPYLEWNGILAHECEKPESRGNNALFGIESLCINTIQRFKKMYLIYMKHRFLLQWKIKMTTLSNHAM